MSYQYHGSSSPTRRAASHASLLSGCEVRADIIHLLCTKGEHRVQHICDALKIDQPTASHHLTLLRISNAVTHRRHGKMVYYSIHKPWIEHTLALIKSIVGQ